MADFSAQLAGGDVGTDETIAAMSALADDAAARASFRKLVPKYGMTDLFRLLKARVEFRRDPTDVELIRDAEVALRMIVAGQVPKMDCDDRAVLAVAMMKVRGWPCAFVVIATEDTGPFKHVFAAIIRDGQVTYFDPQEMSRLGECAPYKRMRIYVA